MSEGATGYTPCEEYGHDYESEPWDLTLRICQTCRDWYRDDWDQD